MKNVMKKAWEIAKNGQKIFGGKASEYLAEALKTAWKMYKNAKAISSKGIIAKRQGDYIIIAIREDKEQGIQTNGKEWEVKSLGTKQDNEGVKWNFTRVEAHLTIKALGNTISSTLNKEIVWA